MSCKKGRILDQVNRPAWRREKRTWWHRGYCHHPKYPRQRGVKDFVAEYGHVIVDECHHLSAFTFEQVMKQVKAKYVLGLTATPERKDGHHPIIYMQSGPIRHKLSARSMTVVTPFEHEVVPRLTEFCLPPEQIDTTIQEVYAALVDDRARNELILADLLTRSRRPALAAASHRQDQCGLQKEPTSEKSHWIENTAF